MCEKWGRIVTLSADRKRSSLLESSGKIENEMIYKEIDREWSTIKDGITTNDNAN